MRNKLKLLLEESNKLRAILDDNIEQIKLLMIDIYKEDNNLTVGDKIQFKNYGTVKGAGVITEFIPSTSNLKTCPQIQLLKKDGTLGKRSRIIFDWYEIEKLKD